MKKKNKKGTNQVLLYFITFFLCIGIICIATITFYNVKYPVKYSSLISKYSVEYNLNKELVASVINEESHFNKDTISKKGAIGLMQIMPRTGEYIAQILNDKDYTKEKLFLPEVNIKYGCFYLRYLQNKFPQENEFLSAYNAGETTVNLWLSKDEYSKDGKVLKKIPFNETKNYTHKVLKGKRFYKGRL